LHRGTSTSTSDKELPKITWVWEWYAHCIILPSGVCDESEITRVKKTEGRGLGVVVFESGVDTLVWGVAGWEGRCRVVRIVKNGGFSR